MSRRGRAAERLALTRCFPDDIPALLTKDAQGWV